MYIICIYVLGFLVCRLRKIGVIYICCPFNCCQVCLLKMSNSPKERTISHVKPGTDLSLGLQMNHFQTIIFVYHWNVPEMGENDETNGSTWFLLVFGACKKGKSPCLQRIWPQHCVCLLALIWCSLSREMKEIDQHSLSLPLPFLDSSCHYCSQSVKWTCICEKKGKWLLPFTLRERKLSSWGWSATKRQPWALKLTFWPIRLNETSKVIEQQPSRSVVACRRKWSLDGSSWQANAFSRKEKKPCKCTWWCFLVQ